MTHLTMKTNEFPCANCKMRAKYDTNPKSLVGRFWRWHIGFCPGWKAYMNAITEEERQAYIRKYDIKSK